MAASHRIRRHCAGRIRSATTSTKTGNRINPTVSRSIVREGERFDQLQPHSVEPDVNPEILILHEDDEFVILSKPAPLPIHECGRFHRNSLRYILNLVYFLSDHTSCIGWMPIHPASWCCANENALRRLCRSNSKTGRSKRRIWPGCTDIRTRIDSHVTRH